MNKWTGKISSWWDDKQRRPWMIGGGVVVLLLVILLLGRGGKEENQVPTPSNRTTAQTSTSATAAETARQSAEGAGAVAEPTRGENQRPQVTAIRLTPVLIYPGTQVLAEVTASDPEEQEVTFAYQWRRNGEDIAEATSADYTVEGLLKGDLLQVTVIPFDGELQGEAVTASSKFAIMNRPPTITSFPPTGLDSGRFRYEVKSTDPDGDSLVYALVESPPGMTVDAQTGLVEWAAAAAIAGTFQVRLTVSDGEATTYQAFSLKLTQP